MFSRRKRNGNAVRLGVGRKIRNAATRGIAAASIRPVRQHKRTARQQEGRCRGIEGKIVENRCRCEIVRGQRLIAATKIKKIEGRGRSAAPVGSRSPISIRASAAIPSIRCRLERRN